MTRVWTAMVLKINMKARSAKRVVIATRLVDGSCGNLTTLRRPHLRLLARIQT